MRMSLILAGSPSVTENVRFTRLRSMGVTVVTTSAPYRLRLMYWRLSSCSARSASALSKGRPSANPTSRMAFCKASLSNSLVPTNSTLAMVGRSSTTTTSTLPFASRRTSLKSPNANKARIAAAPLSSLYSSPTRIGMEANTVPGSTRCRPSTRISWTLNGSKAHAACAALSKAATAKAVRAAYRFLDSFICDAGAILADRQRLVSPKCG